MDIFAISFPGTWEMILIVVLVLIIFGGSKIPKLAKDLGSGIREFKNALMGKDKDSNKQSVEDGKKKDES
jgi:sec-independent protein translocase protein TatA